MFDNLIESRPRRERSISQTVLSLVVHTIIIIAAVKLTSGAAETVKKILADTHMAFLKPPPPPPPPPPPEQKIVSANPPPKGFQSIMPPKVIPTEIPPVNLNEKFDPKNFSGKGIEGGVGNGVVGGTGPVNTQETFTNDQVDDPIQQSGCPEPKYPPALKAVGVQGNASLRYIVAANGKVERGSVQVMSSTNKAFEEPAVEAILACAYKPAKIRGSSVRQLVEQTIRFKLGG